MVGLPATEGRMLLHTLTTWFATGGNVTESGALLFCHRNTVRNRLRRIEDLSGRSLADPRGIAELYVAAQAISLFGADALT
jgi:DNA-binding PucR family transcriptional regulator